MTNQTQKPNDKRPYDLEERTALFGEEIIEFVSGLHGSSINRSLISQLIRAGTSIGANYMEADAAESKKDFQHKIALCKKEAKEVLHWLRMIAKANKDRKDEVKKLWKESHELVLIFSAILNKKKNKVKDKEPETYAVLNGLV